MVKNNNGWLWTAVIMIVLNVILLGYIFLGNGGVSLSPASAAATIGDGCNDGNTNTQCFIGDTNNPSTLNLYKSVIGSGNDYLNLYSGSSQKGINIAGVGNTPTKVNVNGDLTAVGKISFTKGQNIGTFYTTTNFMGICFANAGSGTYSSCGITLSPGGGIDPTWRCQFGCSQT